MNIELMFRMILESNEELKRGWKATEKENEKKWEERWNKRKMHEEGKEEEREKQAKGKRITLCKKEKEFKKWMKR